MTPRESTRASDADRDHAVDRLHVAVSEGRLGSEELDERVRAALTARTYGELDRVTGDLPDVPEATHHRRVATPVLPALPDDQWGGASGPRAGFWRRFWALMLDSVLGGLAVGVLTAVLRDGVGFVVGVLVYVAYFVYFEGSESGATPGKRALGIRIIDETTGDPIGYGRSFLRLIGRFISGLFLELGYLWMLWDGEKQCWHDKMSHDVVVPTADYPPRLHR